MNRSLWDGEGWKTEPDRTFDVTLSYAKFYVKYHISSLRSTKKEQGTVSFSLHQPLGPVSISRRSAAGGCTDVQDRRAEAASASRPTCVCIAHARVGSSGAVVRAESTTGMLLARGIHQPKHHRQQEAAGDGRRRTDRVRAGRRRPRSAFAELDHPDRTWIPTFRLKSLELASLAPKFSSPAARL